MICVRTNFIKNIAIVEIVIGATIAANGSERCVEWLVSELHMGHHL